MELLDSIYQWFMGLGEEYGVNPIIFGTIYVGAIPFFTLSIAWLVRNYKRNKPIVLPVLSASGCFVSAYIYLIIAGQNVPWWVYALVVGMLAYGAWSTIGKVQKQIREEPNEI